MSIALRLAETFAIAIWLGSLTFLGFAVWPALFGALSAEQARLAIQAIWPRYYLGAILSGLVLIAVGLMRGINWGWTGMQPLSLGLFAVATTLTVVAWRMQNARAVLEAPGGLPIFLNLAVFLMLLAYAVWMSMRGY